MSQNTSEARRVRRSKFWQRKKICSAASGGWYVAQNVGAEWPIPVFFRELARPLCSAPTVIGDRGSRVHDCGQRALAARPACRKVAD
jgi:hypothetical protein